MILSSIFETTKEFKRFAVSLDSNHIIPLSVISHLNIRDLLILTVSERNYKNKDKKHRVKNLLLILMIEASMMLDEQG